jgi:hypothetical protein
MDEKATEAAEEARLARAKRRRLEEDEDEEDEDDELDEEEIAERDEELRRRLLGLDEEEDEDEADDRPRRRKRVRREGRGPRVKLDPARWQKVRLAIIFVIIAAGLWGLALLLHEIYVLIGLFAGPQYAKAVVTVHPNYEGSGTALDGFRLIVAIVGGTDALNANLILDRISQVVFLLQGVVMIVGCAIALAVPPRFGTRGLVLTTLIVSAVNVLMGVAFRLLPALGAIPFTLLPLLGPEMAMTQANTDRSMPLQLAWTSLPYLQVLLTVFIVIAFYSELFLFPLFLRAVAQSLRSLALEHRSVALEESALGLTKLALSQVFIQVAYQLAAMTGTSDVLGYVLRAVYSGALAFFAFQLVWYIMLLLQMRSFIQVALDKDAEED